MVWVVIAGEDGGAGPRWASSRDRGGRPSERLRRRVELRSLGQRYLRGEGGIPRRDLAGEKRNDLVSLHDRETNERRAGEWRKEGREEGRKGGREEGRKEGRKEGKDGKKENEGKKGGENTMRGTRNGREEKEERKGGLPNGNLQGGSECEWRVRACESVRDQPSFYKGSLQSRRLA